MGEVAVGGSGSKALRQDPDAPDAPIGMRWTEVLVRWPYAQQRLELDVVTTRDLTTLEWVLERILDEFPESPPTLAESAVELGLADPVFLRDTLRSLVRLGAVQQRSRAPEPAGGGGDAPAAERGSVFDLSDAELTESGRELFRRGKIDGEPEHPRMDVVHDVLSGEHVPFPPEPREQDALNQLGALKLIGDDDWPEASTAMTLDQVRACAQERGERYHRGATRIRQAAVAIDDSFHFEAAERVGLFIDPQGRVVVSGERLRPSQLEWLRANSTRLVRHAALDTLPRLQGLAFPIALAASRMRELARIGGAKELAERVTALIKGARQEVVLHGALVGDDATLACLRERAKAGVRCIVRGGETALVEEWVDRGPQPPGFIAIVPDEEAGSLVAAVADGSQFLAVEGLQVLLGDGGRITVAAAVEPRSQEASGVRERLLAGTLARMAERGELEDSQQYDLIALFLGAEESVAARVVGRIYDGEVGIERVHELRRVGSWFGGDRPRDAEMVDWTARARDALEDVLDGWGSAGGAEHSTDSLEALVAAARGLVDRNVLFERLIEKIPARSAAIDSTALAAFDQLVGSLERLMPGAPLLSTPVARRFVDAVLDTSMVTTEAVGADVVQLVVRIAGEERSRRWAARLSGRWREPDSIPDLAAWLRCHAALRPLLAEAFVAAATRSLHRLAATQRGLLDETTRQEIADAWSACKLPAAEVDRQLPLPSFDLLPNTADEGKGHKHRNDGKKGKKSKGKGGKR